MQRRASVQAWTRLRRSTSLIERRDIAYDIATVIEENCPELGGLTMSVIQNHVETALTQIAWAQVKSEQTKE